MRLRRRSNGDAARAAEARSLLVLAHFRRLQAWTQADTVALRKQPPLRPRSHSSASAEIVCDGEGECWHAREHAEYKPEFGVPQWLGFFLGDMDKGSPPHREPLPTHPHKLMDRTGRGRCSIRSVAYAARAHVVTGHHRPSIEARTKMSVLNAGEHHTNANHERDRRESKSGTERGHREKSYRVSAGQTRRSHHSSPRQEEKHRLRKCMKPNVYIVQRQRP